MKVQDLSQFGKPLEMPKKAQKKMLGIVLTALKEKFGLLGMAPFLVSFVAEQRRIKKAYPEPIAKAAAISPEFETNLVLLPALFNVMAQRYGREQAYEFVKDIFQRVAVHSIPAIYQIDDLLQCEGDRFENFKKFNVAMFEAIDRQGTWKSDSIVDEPDRLRIRVVSCANVDLFSAVDCPDTVSHTTRKNPCSRYRNTAAARRPGGCCGTRRQ